MNYLKIYNKIIDKAKNREINGYIEKHHIIPKCLGGLNKKENLVKLTAREHFICHLLLSKIYGGKMIYTLFRMSKNGKYNSKKYEYFINYFSGQGNPFYGKKHSEETKIKMSKIRKGKPSSNLNKKMSEEQKLKLRNINLGHKHSEETKKKISENGSIKVINLNTGKIFNSILEASKFYNINNCHIGQVCRKNRKSSGGYKWAFI